MSRFESQGIRMDQKRTLDQLTAKLSTVKEGLPELIKNSKDHYLRLKIDDKNKRQIVIIVSRDKKNLGVLDFGGATNEDFEGWSEWSSNTSGRKNLSENIEAGYGNGGKAFMVRGCGEESYMCGYSEGRLTKKGFINSDRNLTYEVVVFKDEYGNKFEDFKYSNPEDVLNEELSDFGVSLDNLPSPAQEIFRERQSFTLVTLKNVKDWKDKRDLILDRLIKSIPSDVMFHGQASLSIEMCTIWVQQGKKLLYNEPLKLAQLEPFEGLEEIPPITLPDEIIDPHTDEKIKINEGILILKTSSQNLRISDRMKPRNIIRIKNRRNVVSYWSIAELAPYPASGHVYGELICNDINEEHLTGADRTQLVDTPLARALKAWVENEVRKLSDEIQGLLAKRTPAEDQEKASETLSKLRNLMKTYLEPTIEQEDGEDEGRRSEREQPEFGRIITEIIIEPGLDRIDMASGTEIPLIVKCFERKGEKLLPIKNADLCLGAEKKIIEISKDRSLKALSPGETKIWFETKNGKVKSERIPVYIWTVKDLKISSPSHLLKQGERIKIPVEFIGENNQFLPELFMDCSIDESGLGKIGRAGMFTAGGEPGTATIRIKYGNADSDMKIAKINIGTERIERHGKGGSNVPNILLCTSIAPNTEDLPDSQRTHPGGTDHPTIIDFDPVWEGLGVIWINPTSSESMKVRTSRGRSGPMGTNTKTFREFLALKSFDILKRLKVREKTGESPITSEQFFNFYAESEIETSGFLESAYDLVGQLVAGDDTNE